jgi:predicted secreted Zn-dependent protease
VKDAEQAALKEVWTRLFDRVKHMAEKLADPKSIFRDSMVDNAREICALLPRLNFNDDPQLEAMRQEVESKLIKHPEALRNDPDLRRDTAAEAKAIMDKMSVFMGGV